MNHICPRCKYPSKDHAPYRSFCPLSEKEALSLIIDLQLKMINEYEEDHRRLDNLDLFLRDRGWVDFGFNASTTYESLTGILTTSDDEYYLDSDNFAPTLREAIDLWIKNNRNKEDNNGCE